MDEKTEKLVRELLGAMRRSGFQPCTEQYQVCARALDYLGYSYLRTEELASGATIDCSTLVSQSFWEGATIGVPFIAESQRIASSGQSVSSLEAMIPSDVLIKYASLDQSPDKIYNHVGLYLGRDDAGIQWLVESAGGRGVVLTPVQEFNARGGIKRFSLSRDVFNSPQARKALALASCVPKFGRLGVRQYRKQSAERSVHRGLDIYTEPGTTIRASIGGALSRLRDDGEVATVIEISSHPFTVRYMHIEPKQSLREGQRVRRGQIIGRVIPPPSGSNIKYAEIDGSTTHMHLEIRRKLKRDEDIRGKVVASGFVYLNHLYLSKIGVLPLPF